MPGPTEVQIFQVVGNGSRAWLIFCGDERGHSVSLVPGEKNSNAGYVAGPGGIRGPWLNYSSPHGSIVAYDLNRAISFGIFPMGIRQIR